MQSINRILFPADLSERCYAAAPHVEAMAKRFQSEVMLLHVTDSASAVDPESNAEMQLDQFHRKAFNSVDVDAVVKIGDPANQIIRTAHDWKPDLLMIPTRGLGSYRPFLLGSVAAKVLHDVSCPVWTDVHPEAPERAPRIRKVLCAIDLGPRSRCTLSWAASFAAEFSAEFAAVHIVPRAEAGAPAHYLDCEFIAAMAHEAKARMESLVNELNLPATILVESGAVATGVAHAAEAWDADLLVIGRHAPAGLMGHLRQNAYSILRTSTCPVVSV